MGDVAPQQIEAVRRFSRFYTRKIGVLHEGLLNSPFTLTEGRIVYEIAHHERTTGKQLAAELGLDPGYVSRVLSGLESKGHIYRCAAEHDARQSEISLTEQGEDAFSLIDTRSRLEVSALLQPLPPDQRQALCDAMATVQKLLGEETLRRVPFILRPHQAGDIGWVVRAHGLLYAREFGWDETFEGLVAEIAGQFIKRYDPRWERCWMAEKDGVNVGSVFLVKRDEQIAQLRLLIVEPHARGLGVGRRLVEECIRFAREKRYAQLTLWTNSVLTSARRIYAALGFELISEEPHCSFGQELVGEHWTLQL
ncbi:MAG: MarR family transcriptional regulator [Gammaproteobacteria bacterium]|nr:MarR family transcriptional regulator [Gammaproteobacteria bacterium]